VPAPTPQDWLSARQIGPAVVVKLPAGDLYHDEAIGRLGDEFARLIDAPGCRRLVVDFGSVGHVASDLIAVLISAHNRLLRQEGRLVLCSLGPELRELFAALRLDRILPIAADEQEALAGAH
jgi:anti-anti-sigma factor